jgi:predicted transport protein
MPRAFPRMLSNRWYSFGLSNLHISKRKNILFEKKKNEARNKDLYTSYHARNEICDITRQPELTKFTVKMIFLS